MITRVTFCPPLSKALILLQSVYGIVGLFKLAVMETKARSPNAISSISPHLRHNPQLLTYL
ncbi:hypothetical protein ACF3DV_16515 [Chlorogloeopsis fritschii PCC 9212]|uniref:hypothetical protein n=1 Tax=Chlorogloeopsis fritschii TaxID=1124 RepID=UPI0003137C66|nr:hypothetical protein [Chlorogloeopsis fritschii]